MIIDSDEPPACSKVGLKISQEEYQAKQKTCTPEFWSSEKFSEPKSQDPLFKTPFATPATSKQAACIDTTKISTSENSITRAKSPVLTKPIASVNLASSSSSVITTITTTIPTSPSIEPQTAIVRKQGENKPKAQDEAHPLTSDEENENQKLHILIAATGSVATIKIPLIIAKLRKMYGSHAVIQLIVTTAAEHFLRTVKMPTDIKIWHDHDEWTSRRGVAEAVLHVKLRRWADILLIAPLSANTLAKMANGICDNLITSVFRAWNSTTPVVVAPAMNTHMYTNPMTKKHLAVLQTSFPYVHVLKPIEKVLVCGDIGMGGMREWTDVVDNVVRHLGGLPKSVEEEEEEEEREKREKRAAAKKRRESVEVVQTPEKIKESKIEEVDEEEDHDEDEYDEDEDEDEKSEKAQLVTAKPKLVRSNTAEI